MDGQSKSYKANLILHQITRNHKFSLHPFFIFIIHQKIFRSHSSDRLSFISYKFDFFVFINGRGVRGEFRF